MAAAGVARRARRPWLVALALACLPAAASFDLLGGGQRRTTQIVGRQLLVDGQPLHLKGINWNPVPKGGVHPKDLDFRGFVEADADLMAFAGINAVRTYETLLDKDVLDILWRKNIYVLNTVYIYGGVPVSSLVEKVHAVMDHPAILMWCVGNEWNYNGLYVGLPFPQALDKVKEAVRLIKQHDPYHPVATIHGEMPSPETIAALSDVDAWGINKYSGLSFGNLFEEWAKVSDKPIFLGEYGADAYNSKSNKVDEAAQAKATKVLTEEIVAASSVRPGGACIGGLIFELADEWWKDGSGNPREHDIGGVSPGGGPYPDETFNEEWWGLLNYDGMPREAFKAYADTPVPGAAEQVFLDTASCSAYAKPLRMNACGAYPACKGELGNCCPGKDGQMAACCSMTETTASPTEFPVVQTTWMPPTAGQKTTTYQEQGGMFANDPFEVGTSGCEGVGECQFMTRTDAQAFCDAHGDCTIVLMHPFSGYCAGGLGCFTPRKGHVFSNSLWDRSGGKAWVKGQSIAGGSAVAPGASKYIFAGFYKGAEAHDVCRQFGKLAMPKTAADRQALQAAVDAAEAAGKLSKQWPANTIWIGGQWNSASQRWEWDDGTEVNTDDVPWADGQPSAKIQDQEPFLCMVLDGHMHDSDPPYSFGVLCETDGSKPMPLPPAPAPETTTPSPPSPAPPLAPLPPSDAETVTVHDVSQGPHEPESDEDHYWFSGFAQAAAARQSCGSTGQLAMPKSEMDIYQMKGAINKAIAHGEMVTTWPRNIIWLGGQYNVDLERWQWDDGTPIVALNWGLGQPSGAGRQAGKPWLGMHTDGTMLDSDTPNEFGVMCELKPNAPAGNAGGLADKDCCTYKFEGFAVAAEAPSMCKRSGGRLAMPKTSQEQEDLRLFIGTAVDAGQMSSTWPKNTAWLGGQWQGSQWLWNDGDAVTDVRWAEGQPSSSDNQAKEPYLCMVTEGVIHDSDPPYDFAVVCEYGVRHDAAMVCMIDVPVWLKMLTVIALGCLVVAGLRRWQGPLSWQGVLQAWDTASWGSMQTTAGETFDTIMQLPRRDRILLLPMFLVLASAVASILLGPCLFPLSLPALVAILGGLVLAGVMNKRQESMRCPMIFEAYLPSLPQMLPSVLFNRGAEPMSPNSARARSSSPNSRHRGASGV